MRLIRWDTSWQSPFCSRYGKVALALILALGILALFAFEHNLRIERGLTCATGFALLPLLPAIAFLSSLYVAALGSLLLALHLDELIHHYSLIGAAGGALRLIAWCGLVVLAVLVTCRREEIEERERQLLSKTELMRSRLVGSLKASTLAHEIRQPLFAIQMLCNQLQRHLEQRALPDPVLAATCSSLSEVSDELNETISTIAGLHRGGTTEPVSLDLAEIVRGTLSKLVLQWRLLKIDLVVEGLDQPLPLLGDPAQLAAACSNLIRNAIEALSNSPVGRRQLLVRLERSEEQAVLVVADSGPGLRTDNAETSPTFQSSKPYGMGLGLLTVEMIAAAHHGRLEKRRSATLGGAEMRLVLPC